MAIALLPFVVFCLGLFLYGYGSNAKMNELGRIMIFCGLFVTLLVASKHVVKFL